MISWLTSFPWTTSVYRQSCVSSSATCVFVRPENAAIPQSEEQRSGYQALWARKKLPSPKWTVRTPATGLPSVARESMWSLKAEHRLGLDRDQVMDDLQRLILLEPVLDDELGQVDAVHAPGHVVARRDRQERAGVVDEAGGLREPDGLGEGLAEALDRVGSVDEPPGHPHVHRRVEPRQRAELAAVDGLVHREHDKAEGRVRPERVEHRLQRAGRLDGHRYVRAHVRPVRLKGLRVVVPVRGGVERHEEPVLGCP